MQFHLPPILLIFLILRFHHVFCVEISQHFEDITVKESVDESPQIMDKMQSSKRQVSDKAKKAMMSLLSLKNTNAKSENYQIFKEDDQVSSGGPAYGPKPSKKGKRIKHTREDSDTDVTGNLIGRDDSRLVVAGIPDMSDPCFRRYANCIIVNAQPYERRSTTGLITCKAHCLQSQSGAYNCRSFIYDNINQVCDLFAHRGDQAPARLLKFQTRDYFEPTNAVQCLTMINSASPVSSASPASSAFPASSALPASLAFPASSVPPASLEMEITATDTSPAAPTFSPFPSLDSNTVQPESQDRSTITNPNFTPQPNESETEPDTEINTENLRGLRSEHFSPQQPFREEVTQFQPSDFPTEQPIASATATSTGEKSEEGEEEEQDNSVSIPVKVEEITPTQPTSEPTQTHPTLATSPVGSTDEVPLQGTICPVGKITKYLKTEGFELYHHDENEMKADDPAVCIEACEKNFVLGHSLDCKSFDYFGGSCYFTDNAAVPVGTGQLKPKTDSFYYEEVCVDRELAENCPPTFSRYPQMILVGFAESVSDSSTFEHCFDSCLNSLELFGFNCSSGMYYFEESQLNCILNTEDRLTQAELFTEENTDIVDYFEVGCKPQRNFGKSAKRMHGVKTFSKPIGTQNLVLASTTSTEWSECIDGKQHRRKDCNEGVEDCGMESRSCYLNVSPTAADSNSEDSDHWVTMAPSPSDDANDEADIAISSVGAGDSDTEAATQFPKLISQPSMPIMHEDEDDRPAQGEAQPPGFIPSQEFMTAFRSRSRTSTIPQFSPTELPFTAEPHRTSTTVPWETSTRAIKDRLPTRKEIAEMKAQIRKNGFNCPLNFCCKVFTTCAVGLRHNTKTRRLEYCRTPCNELQKHRRLL